MTNFWDIILTKLKTILFYLSSKLAISIEFPLSSSDDFKQLSLNKKIYTYPLPREFSTNDRLDLHLVYQTYSAVANYLQNISPTNDPSQADLFFVPINLHGYQIKNKDPSKLFKYLKYLGKKRNHLIIATGDFPNRGNGDKYGQAYVKTYQWLDKFILLALESSNDLIPNVDIGIIPLNTLSDKPFFNQNVRKYLYSFLGTIEHRFLPANHVRSKLTTIDSGRDDVFIGDKLNSLVKSDLSKQYQSMDDYELVARNSIFTLCPKGYGSWTYRFYQAINWGSIPVLLSDDYILPFQQYISYDQFTIRIPEHDILKIDKTIRNISQEKIREMQRSLQENQKYFTYHSFFTMLNDTINKYIL